MEDPLVDKEVTEIGGKVCEKVTFDVEASDVEVNNDISDGDEVSLAGEVCSVWTLTDVSEVRLTLDVSKKVDDCTEVVEADNPNEVDASVV